MRTISRYFLPILGVGMWLITVEVKASSPIVHYWIDHHKLVEETTTLNDSQLNLDIDMSEYPGAHTLYYRIQDQDGNWSAINCVPFISNPQRSGGNAKSCDWWIDKNSNILQQTLRTDNTAIFDINCENLASGAHTLYYRMEDQFGNFGSVMSQVFYKNQSTESHISWYRYWWNDRYDLAEEITVNTKDLIFMLDTDLDLPDYVANDNNSSLKAHLNMIFGDDLGNISQVWSAEVDYEQFLSVKELETEPIWTCHSNGTKLTISGLTPGKGILRIFALDGREISASVPHEDSQIYTVDPAKAVIICYNGVSIKIVLN